MTLAIPPSGFFYPNKIGRIMLNAARNLVGEEQFAALLRDHGLTRYLEAPPPDNLVRAFDFADFAALVGGLDAIQTAQPRTPSLVSEVGRLCFREGVRTFGSPSFLGALAYGYQLLPLNVKMKVDLLSMATIFTTLSDQHSDLEEHDDHFAYIIHRCPICWGRHSAAPLCTVAGAMLEEALHWSTHLHFDVIETRCCAAGDSTCTFVVKKPEAAAPGDAVSDRNP